jgi:hypothetical protein
VRITQAIFSSASNASIAAGQFLIDPGVERVECLRPVEADDADFPLVSTMMVS